MRRCVGGGKKITYRQATFMKEAGEEGKYIRACLRAELMAEGRPAAPAGLDWDKFTQIVIEQQLSGVLAKMSRTHPEWLPRAVSERLLYRRYRQLLFHADWGARQAGDVLAMLAERHIPVMVLKGWALVALVYGGDYSQRPAVDIDLLVKPEDAGQAIEALQALGYAATEMEPWPGYFQRFLNGSHYTRAEGTGERRQVFNVDLHWGFPDAPYYDRRIAVEALFERSLAIEVAGVAVRSLAIEDMLIYGSVHMAHHGYQDSLSRYYDMAALMRRAGSGLDWQGMLARASAWKVMIPLRRMLAKVEELWPGVVPGEVLRAAEKLRSGWREGWIDWGLRKVRNKEAVSILLAVWNTPGAGWRLRFFLETAFPGEDYLRHYFGPAAGKLWPLLNIRRFMRFFGR